MLTLQELKRIPDMPGYGAKLPTAKQLRESGKVVAKERLGQGAEIAVYQNGYVLYRADSRSTVFPFHSCGDYLYISYGTAIRLPEQFFYSEKWYLRLVLEGEDRLARNREEKERSWNVSYSAMSEEWAAMGDFAEPVAENFVRRETVAEILQALTEKQKFIIQKYYLDGETDFKGIRGQPAGSVRNAFPCSPQYLEKIPGR